MKEITYVREGYEWEETDSSYELSYYRLMVVSKTRICNSQLVDELFRYMKLDCLSLRLQWLKEDHKRLVTEIERHGNIAIVTITKRPWFKR